LRFAEAATNENTSDFSGAIGKFIWKKKRLYGLNTASLPAQAFLLVPKNAKIDAPVFALFRYQRRFCNFNRRRHLPKDARRNLRRARSLTNAVVEVLVAGKGKVKHYRVQRIARSVSRPGAKSIAA